MDSVFGNEEVTPIFLIENIDPESLTLGPKVP